VKVTSETLPERQVKLQIEVDDDRQAQAMEEAYKRLAPRVQIRGFRPGKAPRPLIEKQLGRHRLLDEAMEILLPKVYQEVIEEQDLSPVASPSVELVSHEPLVFTATVPLRPVVELGDYQSLRVPREQPTVTDEQVEESMRDLRRRYGTIEPVDRPAQEGDIVRGNLRAEVDGAVLYEQDEIEFRLTEEALSSLPGLLEAVAGMSKGEEKDHESAVSSDFDNPRLAGKTVSYHVVVSDVKEEKLADENADFAKEVGEGFESVQALRDRIRSDLQQSEDQTALREYESQVVDALLENAQIEYPQVLLDHEIEHILEDQANLNPQDQRAQELYLQRLGKSEQEVKDSVRPEADERLRRSLVLSQFAEAENITVEDAEIETELQSMAESAGEQADALRRIFDTENGRETLRRSLLTRKTLARLVELGSQDGAAATESPSTTEETSARPKARRSGPRKSEEEPESEAADA
jgi:trigger factor